MNYLKVWADFLNIIAPFSDAKVGWLFRSMLKYVATGEEPVTEDETSGLLWAVAKRDIDVNATKAEKNRKNGLNGGRPKTGQNQTKANESENNPKKPNESEKKAQDKTRQDKTYTRQDKTRHDMTGQDILTLSEEDVAEAINRDQRIEEAAREVGLTISTKAMMQARELESQYGLDELIKAIGASVDVPKWSYVAGILRNGGVNNGHDGSCGNADATIRSQYGFLDG